MPHSLIVHPRKGSEAISDLADNVFSVWRNKAKELEIQKLQLQKTKPASNLLDKPDCLLTCDKNRNGEWEGKIALWFDKPSYQYLNHQSQRPIQYVNFSNTNNQEKTYAKTN